MRIVNNIIANGFARLWSAMLQFLLTPIFVKLLGAESFGLVTFYNTVLLTLVFLDWAISPALTREFARMMGRDGAPQAMANLLRSFEAVSWLVAFFLGLGLFVVSGWIADHWLGASGIDAGTTATAIRLMALILIAQWPLSLYSAGFIALFQQSTLTAIRVSGMSLQLIGAALLLYFYQPSVLVFFGWQALISAFTTLVLAIVLWRRMPSHPGRAQFSVQALKSTWRFSIGNLLIGCASCLLAQADKLVVAKFTGLVSLAAYGLCFTLGLLITNLIVAPVQSVLLPRFSRLVAHDQQGALEAEYQFWTQFLALLAFPIAAVLAGLPAEVVSLWLGEHIDLLSQMRVLLPLVALGVALSAITFPVYCVQLAVGWTKLSVAKNLVALVVVLPALWLLVPKYGAIVGAWCWLGVNLGYYLIEVPVMHRRILKSAMWEWYARSTLPAWAVMLVPVLLAHFFVPASLPPLVQFWLVVFMLSTVFVGLLAVLPYPRRLVLWLARNWRAILASQHRAGLITRGIADTLHGSEGAA